MTAATLQRLRADFFGFASKGCVWDLYELGPVLGAWRRRARSWVTCGVFRHLALTHALHGLPDGASVANSPPAPRTPPCCARRVRKRAKASAAQSFVARLCPKLASPSSPNTHAQLKPAVPSHLPGTGNYAVVRRCVHRDSGEALAVKVVRLPPDLAQGGPETLPPCASPPDGETDLDAEDIFKEVAVLRSLDSPHVLRLRQYYLSPGGNTLYVVTDLFAGGQLLHALLAQGEEAYSERDARHAFAALLRGLNHLHARGVTHRDVKLDNLLLATAGDLGTVRIVDFGMAAACFEDRPEDESGMTWLCGSAAYMAPEVATRAGPYTCAVDLWSAGVVLHLLLTGLMPFAAPSALSEGEDPDDALLEAARAVGWVVSYDGPEWRGVSPAARAFVAQLLTVDPTQRLTATAALMHEWIAADVPGTGSLSGTLSQLRRFALTLELPSFTLPPGTFLADAAACAFAAHGGLLDGHTVFLIKKGTVEVLVDDAEDETPRSVCSADSGRLSSAGSGRLRRVCSRGAGELVGELQALVDSQGRLSFPTSADAPRPSVPPKLGGPSLKFAAQRRLSSGSCDEEAPLTPAQPHCPSPWDSPPPSSHPFHDQLGIMASEGSHKGLNLLRSAALRVGSTPVELVALQREDLAWALAQDNGLAQEVARFVRVRSTGDLQTLMMKAPSVAPSA